MTLAPAFDAGVTAYTATTTNATNKVTATPKDPEADVLIEVNGAEIANGASAAWRSGENTVKITVTNGTSSTVYTVKVTK